MDGEHIEEYQVIIIGAGASGLGAAKTLEKVHCPYLILEARNRIGGRILGTEVSGVKVDLGASWVHSYGPCNPVRPFVKSLGWKAACLNESNVGRTYIDGEKHQALNCNSLEKGRFYEQNFFQVAEKNSKDFMKDCSIWDAGKDYIQNIDGKISDQIKRSMNLILNMTEHYEGSSLDQLSIRHYEYRKDRGGDFAPCLGWHSLFKAMAEGINVKLNKKVVRIIREQKHVIIECSDDTIYKAKKLIASFPLGVLKKGSIIFQPQLPLRHQQAIKNLGVGIMDKIMMSFQKNFWGSTRWISIAFDERGKYPHFYNFSQKNRNILCCFITDKFAVKCQQKTNQEIIDELVDIFEKIYKKKNVKLLDYAITRWYSDEFSAGSYSSFHVGSEPKDSYELRKPIQNKLWLVGEHCHAEHIGTAHGAFKTGIQAAQQVLQTLKWFDPIKQQKKKQFASQKTADKSQKPQKNKCIKKCSKKCQKKCETTVPKKQISNSMKKIKKTEEKETESI